MSSSSRSRQDPVNSTFSYMVPPGNETNHYYILLSNLPFATSWHDIKDHVRTVCSSVERVEVFGGSTSGWVCVKGRQNFDAAMNLFEKAIFNGRCIFADGRNATKATLIKDVKYTTQQPRQMAQYSSSSSATMSPTGTELSQFSPATSTSTLSQGTEYQFHAPPYNYGEMFAGWSPEAAAGNYVDQPHYNPMPMEQYRYDASYQSPLQYQVSPNGYYPNYASSEPYSAEHCNPGAGVVHTTKRKIIIRQLPSWATMDQIQGLIYHKAGIGADSIQQIDLPPNGGCAIITFEREDAASRAIRKLHGYEYDSRPLSVEHTKEGVSPYESYRPRTPKPHRDAREKRDKGLSSTHHSSSTDKKGSKSHHKSEVVIAHGSSSALKRGG